MRCLKTESMVSCAKPKNYFYRICFTELKRGVSAYLRAIAEVLLDIITNDTPSLNLPSALSISLFLGYQELLQL